MRFLCGGFVLLFRRRNAEPKSGSSCLGCALPKAKTPFNRVVAIRRSLYCRRAIDYARENAPVWGPSALADG